MNPPFGTRNTGIDTAFVLKGMEYASTVYSLHKTSTRDVSRCSTSFAYICIIYHYIYILTTRASYIRLFILSYLLLSQHFIRLAEEHDFTLEVLAELKYDIPKTFKHQKLKTKDVFVDLYRFTHKA